MEINLSIEGGTTTLTERTATVYLHVEEPWMNHVYVHPEEGQHFLVFDCESLVGKMLEMGFPVMTKMTASVNDAACYDRYIEGLLAGIDEELDLLEGENETGGDE